MTIWFSRKINGIKKYCSKSISINYHKKHWRLLSLHTNGAMKGSKEDTYFDLNIQLLGLFLGYTNLDYNLKYRHSPNTKTIRLNKLKRSNKINKWKLFKYL